MATLSGILAWKSSGTEEPGRLQFMGCKSVGCDLTTEQQPLARVDPQLSQQEASHS